LIGRISVKKFVIMARFVHLKPEEGEKEAVGKKIRNELPRRRAAGYQISCRT
jgi:hypothetical protein